MTKRVSLVLTAVLLAASWTCAWSEDVSDAQRAAGVNSAGRLRFLTQKTIKEALQVVLNINGDKAKEDLGKSIALFDKHLSGLVKGDAELGLAAPSATAAAELAKVDPLWAAYKAELNNVLAGKGDVAKLAEANAPLMKLAMANVDFLAEEMKQATGKGGATELNVCARQRMLSQRVARWCFQAAAKQDPEGAKKLLDADVALFEKSQNGLINGDAELKVAAAADADVKAQLEVVAKLWGDYKAALTQAAGSGAADDLKKVADLSLAVLEEANKATSVMESKAAKK